ncbi:MAG: hypothetical protein DWQ40_03130 [Actinobacteria bacterium]|nr:MAG: hypothetical protein DWQ40_03130 [Actinomycetota bacterium]
MRPLRALLIVLAMLLAIPVAIFDGSSARAQSVEDAEDEAADALERAEVASGLVETAIANRAEVELELLASIERLNTLAAELSSLSVGLDRISEQLGFADLELAGIQTDIELRAVDAYMSALSAASMTVVNSKSVEEAMVTGRAVEDIIGSEHEAIDQLIVKKRDLVKLKETYASQLDAVAAKQAEFDAEVEHLTELFNEADAVVAEAIRNANAADAEYRAALDEVAEAKAKAAAEEKESTTTTTNPPGSGATTTTLPNTTTTTGGGGGDPWIGPPEVEQWRGLVSQYFPSHRVDEALQIISCESNGDPDAYNPYSGASGLFQFIPSTWASTAPAAGFPGASPFEPEPNVGSAAWLAAHYESLGLYYWQAWNCKWVLD